MTPSATQTKTTTHKSGGGGVVTANATPDFEDIQGRLPEFPQRSMGISLLRMALAIALLYTICEVRCGVVGFWGAGKEGGAHS